jgi:tRNA G10  N-methylase Trm11
MRASGNVRFERLRGTPRSSKLSAIHLVGLCSLKPQRAKLLGQIFEALQSSLTAKVFAVLCTSHIDIMSKSRRDAFVLTSNAYEWKHLSSNFTRNKHSTN